MKTTLSTKLYDRLVIALQRLPSAKYWPIMDAWMKWRNAR